MMIELWFIVMIAGSGHSTHSYTVPHRFLSEENCRASSFRHNLLAAEQRKSAGWLNFNAMPHARCEKIVIIAP
jgi:hypothetical protein